MTDGRPQDRRRRRGRHVRTSALRPWLTAALLSMLVLGIGVATINTFVRRAAAASSDAVTDIADFPAADPSLPTITLAVPAPPALASQTARHKPVAGLNQAQTDNAVVIMAVAAQMHLPQRAQLVAITTALQETRLRNLANNSVPQSLKYPHQGVDANFDSIGLFQQRPSVGWGTPAQLMDPATSARLFYARLIKVSGWQAKSVGAAAQAVQRSAFPTAYDGQLKHAQQIVQALA